MKTSILKSTKLFCLTAFLPLFAACESQDNDRLEEKAKIEGAAAAEVQATQDKKVLEERSSEMESALRAKQNFYETNSGHFEGNITRGDQQFKIRISLFPNIPRNKSGRVRTPSEVESDLVNLSYNAQIMQWSADNALSAMGCRVEGLKPDLESGALNIISTDCPSSYFLTLQGEQITGTAQPSTNPNVFDVNASRMDEAARKSQR